MGATSRQKIVIIGCGNVAWHIAKKLGTKKNITLEVYNHGVNKNLEEFWKQFRCKTTVGLSHIADDADVYFICVTDSAIADCAKYIHPKNPHALLVHTSGSAAVSELGKRVHGTGVFYPVQTFSKSDEIKWNEVPVLLEAGDKQALDGLRQLAELFSRNVKVLTYPERLKVHLSAVLVNNFVNALYVSAADLLRSENDEKSVVSFKMLEPLITQTCRKALEMEPAKAQTGPARRRDKKVIKKHLHLLSEDRQLQKVYKSITKLIQEQQGRYAELQGKVK